MSDYSIMLPSKPKVKMEDNFKGVYEIDGLYPGYGHTLGNSLRRIILSSLPGAAITSVKIKGVDHEFSVLDGIKEDVVTILIHLKKVRIQTNSDGAQTLKLSVNKMGEVTASDIETPGDVEILNPDVVIATITDKNTELSMEITVDRGLGYVSKEVLQKDKVDVGTISLDAIFTPIRRASYEVENMRVGDRTDFNRLRISIETDGTITPKEALEKSIATMIHQLKAVIGFHEEEPVEVAPVKEAAAIEEVEEDHTEHMKTRVESLELSSRTQNALANANIRTVGGLARKKVSDLLEIDGLGNKGVNEIKEELQKFEITLNE